MSIKNLPIDQTRLAEICRRYHVSRLEIMGSFARGDEGPESDVDILVAFEPDSEVGLEFVALKNELESLTGRKVDLLTRKSVVQSPNKYFRRFALRKTDTIYERA